MTTSVFASLIETLSDQLGRVAQKMLSGLPDGETANPSVIAYLDNFWKTNNSLRIILINSAQLAVKSPLKSVKPFLDSLPVIDLEAASQPRGRTTYLQRLVDPDWENPNVRYSLKLFTEFVAAVFLELTLRRAKIEAASYIEIFDMIRVFIGLETNDDYLKFRALVAPFWANSISIISRNAAKAVSEKVSGFISTVTTSRQVLSVFWERVEFDLFSKVWFQTPVIVDNAVKQLLVIAKKSLRNNNYDLHCSIYRFLMNYMGMIGSKNSEYRASDIFAHAFTTTTDIVKDVRYTGPAQLFHAMLYAMGSHKKIVEPLDKYVDKYLAKKLPTQTATILSAMTIILRGTDYAPILTKSEKFCGPFSSRTQRELHLMFNLFFHDNWKKHAIECAASEYQYELGEFIVYLAAVDVDVFSDHFCPNILMMDFLNDNGIAVYHAGQMIVNDVYLFPCHDALYEMIKAALLSSAVGFAHERHSDTIDPTKMTVFDVGCVVESLGFHDDNVKLALAYMKEESDPIMMPELKPCSVQKSIGKWDKLEPSRIHKSILENYTQDMRYLKEDVPCDEVLSSAVNVIPLCCTNTSVVIEYLVPLIFSEYASVVSSVIRGMQMLIHINRDSVSYILEAMSSILPRRMCVCNEAMYRAMLTVKLIVESIIFIHHNLSDKDIEFFNSMIVIGLCSSSFAVRRVALAIGKMIHKVSSNVESVYNVIEEDGEVISSCARNNTLASAIYSIYTAANAPGITFVDIMNSNIEMVYQFHLAALARRLAVSSDRYHTSAIRDMFLANLEMINKKSMVDNSLTFLNIVIFLVNSVESEFDPLLMNLIKDCCSIINENDRLDVVSLYAMMSSVTSNVCHDIMFTKKLNSALLMPVMYSIRLRIDDGMIDIGDDTWIYYIFEFINMIFNLFDTYGVSKRNLNFTEVDFGQHENPVMIQQMLISFLRLAKLLFTEIRQKQLIEENGPFLKMPVFNPNKRIRVNDQAWVVFLLNLCTGDQEFNIEARKTLGAVLSVFTVPDLYYSDLMNHIEIFEHDTPEVLGNLLRQYYTLPESVERAVEKPIYFEQISLQFRPSFETIDEAIATAERLSVDLNVVEKEFVDITYSCVGALLSLSFMYLLSDDPKLRQAAYRVIVPVTIGTGVIRGLIPAAALKYLDRFHSFLTTSLRHTSLQKLQKLSDIMSKMFGFCGEQFVFFAFKGIHKCPEMAKIALPWINSLVFSRKSAGVFSKIDPVFTYFTTAEYVTSLIEMPLNVDTLALMKKTINEADGSFDIVEYLVVSIFMCLEENPSEKDKYRNIIAYLFTIDPNRVIQLLMNFLTIDFKHYRHIQLTNNVFDMDTFLNETDEESTIAESHIDVYDLVVKFVLSSLNLCASENTKAFEEVIGDIALFAYISPREFAEEMEPLLCKLGIGLSHIDKLVLEKDKARITTKAFSWALCCSELDISVRAFEFLRLISAVVTTDMANVIIRCISIIYRIMYEKNHGITRHRNKKLALFNVLDCEKHGEWKLTAKYLNLLVDWLVEAPPSISIFWFAVALLPFGMTEYISVFNSVLRLLNRVLSDKNVILALKESELPDNFNGILPVIRELSFDNETPALLMTLIQTLINTGLSTLGYKRQNTKIFEVLITIGEDEVNVEQLTDDECNVLLPILAQIAAAETGSAKTTLYELAVKLVRPSTDEKSLIYVAKSIMDRNYDVASFPSKAKLMRVVQQRNIKLDKRVQQQKIPEMMIECTLNETVSANSDSVYTDPVSFPPLYISDTGFFICFITEKLRAIIERYNAQPFTSWSSLIFDTRSFRNQYVRSCDSVVVDIGRDKARAYFPCLQQNMMIDEADEITVPASEQFVEASEDAEPALQIEEQSHVINTHIFLPDRQDIDAVDAHLFPEDTPSVFT